MLSMDAFPGSVAEPFEVTSTATGNYNCIAWALYDDSKFWWPGPAAFFYWPAGLPRTETIGTFTQLFAMFGFEICPDDSLESGYSKIALFAQNGQPTHAARQLHDGGWTSKLGALEDVRHTLHALSGGLYGNVALVFRRKN
jgi:hypothetical protein